MEAGKNPGRVGAPWGMTLPFDSMAREYEMGYREPKILKVVKILYGLWHGRNSFKGGVDCWYKDAETSSD